MNVEILYCAWNRRAFTEVTFELLKRNTDWSKVSRLVVYDDGSKDGTLRYLKHGSHEGPDHFELRRGGWHSIGALMNDFVSMCESPFFVKIDNDIAMPPGWLDIVTNTWFRNQDYEIIGMEAGWNGRYEGMKRPNQYGVLPARHIGGIGLMRTQAFEWRKPVPLSLGKNGRTGFTIWQHRHHVKCGWLKPDIPNVQLDKIPEEPWRSLTDHYIDKGWARRWDEYPEDMQESWAWLPSDLVERASLSLRSTPSRT